MPTAPAAVQSTSRFQFFSEAEAWTIFRLAAFGEAIGWTLLLGGVAWQHYGLINHQSVLQVVGQVHGTLFFIYIAVTLAAYRSLRLSYPQLLIAAAMSIPPYGTLLYEKWLAYRRQGMALRTRRELIVRAIIRRGDTVLVLQPAHGTFWCLPGGLVTAAETSAAALERLTIAQTGVVPKIGSLQYTYEYRHQGVSRVELFFEITNTDAFHNLSVQSGQIPGFDELLFMRPDAIEDLRPAFLVDALCKARQSTKVRLYTETTQKSRT